MCKACHADDHLDAAATRTCSPFVATLTRPQGPRTHLHQGVQAMMVCDTSHNVPVLLPLQGFALFHLKDYAGAVRGCTLCRLGNKNRESNAAGSSLAFIAADLGHAQASSRPPTTGPCLPVHMQLFHGSQSASRKDCDCELCCRWYDHGLNGYRVS